VNRIQARISDIERTDNITILSFDAQVRRGRRCG